MIGSNAERYTKIQYQNTIQESLKHQNTLIFDNLCQYSIVKYLAPKETWLKAVRATKFDALVHLWLIVGIPDILWLSVLSSGIGRIGFIPR